MKLSRFPGSQAEREILALGIEGRYDDVGYAVDLAHVKGFGCDWRQAYLGHVDAGLNCCRGRSQPLPSWDVKYRLYRGDFLLSLPLAKIIYFIKRGTQAREESKAHQVAHAEQHIIICHTPIASPVQRPILNHSILQGGQSAEANTHSSESYISH